MPKVTMPQLGESVAEGTIGKWLKEVGDHVDKYEPIVEVITDKVNAEVPSPFEGVLREILVKEGETVPNDTEIALIEATGEGAALSSASGNGAAPADAGPERTIFGTTGHGPAGSDERPAGSDERPSADAGAGPAGGGTATVPAPPNIAASLTPPAAAPASSNGTTAVAEYEGRMTPAVRRLAREHGVDLSLVTGTGHGGRITRDDLMRFVESGGTAAATGVPGSIAPTQPDAAGPAVLSDRSAPAVSGQAPTQPVTPTSAGVTADEPKRQTPMRRAIAAQMVKAKQTAPHAYTTVETDMSGVVALRESIKGSYQREHGIGLSFVALVGKAVVEALRKHPDVNAHWTDDGLVRRHQINLGIAVAVDDGLIVPVIRNADQLSIHGLNLAIQDFATRARANKLRLDDIQGGTFTLNNTGWFGSVASQPIINVPEVAILSMEAIVKRPVVIESPGGDLIGIRPMMNLCASFDHRATDGAQVGRFVQDVRRWLESADSGTSIW